MIGKAIHNYIANPLCVAAMRFHDWTLRAFGLPDDHTAADLYEWKVAKP